MNGSWKNRPGPGSYSLVLFLALFCGAGYNLFVHYTAWKKGWWSSRQRIYQSLLAVALVLFVSFLYYWNIGGMLAIFSG